MLSPSISAKQGGITTIGAYQATDLHSGEDAKLIHGTGTANKAGWLKTYSCKVVAFFKLLLYNFGEVSSKWGCRWNVGR